MLDTLIGHCAGTAYHPNNLIAFSKQQLRKVRTILSGDTGDKGSGHVISSDLKIQQMNYKQKPEMQVGKLAR
jgi:hypothetical protein